LILGLYSSNIKGERLKKLKNIKGTPFDYSDDKIKVYFEVADKQNTIKLLENLDFIEKIEELTYGFEVNIAIQQIPDIIRYLERDNIAIYALIPKK
jgi:hypothetical protein